MLELMGGIVVVVSALMIGVPEFVAGFMDASAD